MKNVNTRREFIRNATIISAAFALAPSMACSTTKPVGTLTIAPQTYPSAHGFAQEPLGYGYNALQPYIDAETMKIHFSKHHSGYVEKLNKVVFAHESMMGKSLEELLQSVSKLPNDIQASIRNNGGGHWNHTFFWKCMTPKQNTQANTALIKEIEKKWGSVEGFKKAFEDAGKNRFGSGWVWLIKTKKGLAISSTPNQDNPLMDVAEMNGKPLLAIDVWEHAYYLKYQNNRGEYLSNFWNVVDWEKVSERYIA